jgi:hypothetical protein
MLSDNRRFSENLEKNQKVRRIECLLVLCIEAAKVSFTLQRPRET